MTIQDDVRLSMLSRAIEHLARSQHALLALIDAEPNGPRRGSYIAVEARLRANLATLKVMHDAAECGRELPQPYDAVDPHVDSNTGKLSTRDRKD